MSVDKKACFYKINSCEPIINKTITQQLKHYAPIVNCPQTADKTGSSI